MVSACLSRAEVFSFERILNAHVSALGPLKTSIDGGAGWGDTAKTILLSTAPLGKVYAFEPFPGNHRFFEGCDPRVHLHKQAIADEPGTAQFSVPQVVQADDAWAAKGLVGYSSVGYLAQTDSTPAWRRAARAMLGRSGHKSNPSHRNIDVEVTTIERVVTESHLNFVKLDLQGAELKALQGMGKLLDATDILWIEFTNQPGLHHFLKTRGFLLFDTSYLCAGATAADLAAVGLEVRQELTLSTSQPAVLARRLFEQENYLDWFSQAQRTAGLYQTDLLCINPNFLRPFFRMLGQLS